MGCLLNQPQKSSKPLLTIQEYSLIWMDSLKSNEISLKAKKGKSHEVFQQISKDINRTFPNHPHFEQPQNKQIFTSVLQRYALQFPVFGYTQGLNFVVAFILTTKLTQEQALKMMVKMTVHPQLMLIGLYQDLFPLCQLYCQLFWLLAQQYFPKGCRLMKQTNFPDEMWIFQWFITLFIYSLPLSYITEIFHFIVKKRRFAAVRIAIGIFFHLQKYLRSNELNHENIVEYLSNLQDEDFCNKYVPLAQVIRLAQGISGSKVDKFLKQCDNNNWYQQYFSAQSKNRQKMYQQFLGKLELERKDFMESYEQNPSRYSRSTLNILDYIEEDKRRFSKNMSMGLNNKKLIYFASINFNDERYRATTNKNIDF